MPQRLNTAIQWKF
uniref:Uncharacterized protein n=1 Tax=Arundo donax TaxID=35708 RepID=A0A0A9ALF9_ARUDO